MIVSSPQGGLSYCSFTTITDGRHTRSDNKMLNLCIAIIIIIIRSRVHGQGLCVRVPYVTRLQRKIRKRTCHCRQQEGKS